MGSLFAPKVDVQAPPVKTPQELEADRVKKQQDAQAALLQGIDMGKKKTTIDSLNTATTASRNVGVFIP